MKRIDMNHFGMILTDREFGKSGRDSERHCARAFLPEKVAADLGLKLIFPSALTE